MAASIARAHILKQFSFWVAMSAARQGCPVRGRRLYPLLEVVDLGPILEESRIWTEAEFNAWHRYQVTELDARGRLSIGWSAKLVNMLLKTLVYVGGAANPSLLNFLHPPLDNVLIDAICGSTCRPEILREVKAAKPIRGIETYTQYERVLCAIREIAAQERCTLFEVESLWTAAG